MRKVNIFVRDRIVKVRYKYDNKIKEYEWEDNYNISRKFLLRLDKINKCNKHIDNCLFNRKSDSRSRPTIMVLHREGRESTTWRIVLVSLRALEWTGAISKIEIMQK